jgi:hypothetical protein
VRLEGHDATGYFPVPGFVDQQCQHGLVATVHAVKIADSERAVGRNARVLEATENQHGMLSF